MKLRRKVKTIFTKLDINKVYYLASPYSSQDKELVAKRYRQVNLVGAKLCYYGFIIIEPIAMCHQKSLEYELPSGYEYWKTRDRKFISRCDGVIILMLPGWQESIGVTDEIKYAESLDLDIHYVNLDEIATQKEIEATENITDTIYTYDNWRLL